MKTPVGELHFDVPQVREGDFHPSVFERYQRSDKALVGAMREMVIQGVSTRRVSAVLEEMAGFSVSAGLVSRAMGTLDEEIARFNERPLDECEWPYLVIDARYEKVRKAGRVVSQAVLVAAGISDTGQRRILGYWVGDSESEATWGEVFEALKRRGLKGLEMVVSDAHAGIRAALARYFQGIPWQRCRVHLMREMLAKVSYRDFKELARDLRRIFAAPGGREDCLAAGAEVIEKWRKKAPKMAVALEAGLEDCLTVQGLRPELRRRLHSTNMLERLMRELKRRTRVVSIFPSVSSAERLFGALLIEMDEAWQSEPHRYLVLEEKHAKEEIGVA
jgi:transposase-like protein